VGRHLAAPIVLDGDFWGALIAHNAAGDDARVLQDLAGLAALCVANGDVPPADARRGLPEPDDLTGVAGHRAFRDRLAEEYHRAAAAGTALSLVLFDIDRFKAINDKHGHMVGDQVLAEFAKRLVGCARSTDFVARSGGEEFAWIMPGADAAESLEAVQRFRAQVADAPIGPVDRVTASAGICTAAQAGDLEELIRFAEGALYWAKDRGRDAAYVFTPDVVRVLSEDERTQQLSRSHAMRSIRVLARAVDAKDHSTREHSERVADLAVQIAIALGWSMERTAEIRDAGLLHDVGKIGIPDAILLKPGTLTDAEYELIKSHPELGARIASDVLSDEQQAWVRGHHERFDGRGYPDGLVGHDIPEGARILALADSWDVMTSVRSYREAWSLEEALLDCRAEAGRQFWPEAVSALELLYEAGALLVQVAPPAADTPSRPARATEVA
jgi:diguanylate cyclase (GGDEF)-like protein